MTTHHTDRCRHMVVMFMMAMVAVMVTGMVHFAGSQY
jgi:hypothetical protein